jgi:hypothetical protein
LLSGRYVTDPAANSPIQAALKLPLPAGRYEARVYSPSSGGYSPAIWMQSTGLAVIDLPPFSEDIVIRYASTPQQTIGSPPISAPALGSKVHPVSLRFLVTKLNIFLDNSQSIYKPPNYCHCFVADF